MNVEFNTRDFILATLELVTRKSLTEINDEIELRKQLLKLGITGRNMDGSRLITTTLTMNDYLDYVRARDSKKDE